MSGPGAFPIAGGAFVAAVGPSGAGKDSLIAYARARLSSVASVHFVRRVVTRPSDPSLEDHDTMSAAAFAAASSEGAFALSWSSHGLSYGIPVAVDDLVRAGAVAVANLSRAALPDLRDRYARVVVAEITAAPEVLARRLASRGRESAEEIAGRLSRAVPEERRKEPRIVIDNSGPLAEAGERFTEIVRALVRETVPAG